MPSVFERIQKEYKIIFSLNIKIVLKSRLKNQFQLTFFKLSLSCSEFRGLIFLYPKASHARFTQEMQETLVYKFSGTLKERASVVICAPAKSHAGTKERESCVVRYNIVRSESPFFVASVWSNLHLPFAVCISLLFPRVPVFVFKRE